jgi:prephenate dehydrogenase
MSDGFTVAIAGLGLIGGSLARDLAARGARVLASDCNADALRAATDEGIVAGTLRDGSGTFEEVDVFVIATPVDAAVRILADVAPRLAPHTIVTDVCSTKRTLERMALEAGLGTRYVGAHPMAGDTCSGWSASRAGLFAGAPLYLCPTHETSDHALRVVRDLWTGIGAVPEIISAHDHDVLLASTSHLPQLTATALARVLDAAGIPLSRLGPGGRDMTRLAASSADVWTAIVLDNRVAIASALRQLEAELGHLRAAVEADDAEAVRNFLLRRR